MSKLLMNEPPLQVLPSLAVAVGLHEAIVLQQVHYWVIRSDKEKDGRKWVYNTYEQWAQQFPFWKPESIRKIFKTLRDQGLIISMQAAPNAWNKTNFYTIDYDVLALFTRPEESTGRPEESTASMRKNPPHQPEESTASLTETTSKSSSEIKSASAPLSSAKLPPCPHGLLIDLFGQHLPTMPQPKKELWSGKNEESMRSRWKWVMTAVKKDGSRYASTKDEAVAWFDRFFVYVGKSDFLTGRNDKWTSCDLGWLMKLDNFTKVLQGNYENKGAA